MSKHNTATSVSEHIPEVLQQLPRWCRWRMEQARDGHPTKRPDISTARTELFQPWSAVRQIARTRESGIGFCTTGKVEMATPTAMAAGAVAYLLALDLDGCRAPLTGALSPWASDVIEGCRDSFTEVTPSGTGIRIWLAVSKLPEDLASSKVQVPWPAPPDVSKTPELQIFGLGPAGYVTVTGQHVVGTRKTLRLLPDIEWLIDNLGMKRGALFGAVEMPSGEGAPPSLDEIDDAVRRDEALAALRRGDWQKVAKEGHSASESFHRLACSVLRIAHNHGDVTADYLLTRTAWGQGLIHDSREPEKYMRPEWVRRDVARAATKAVQSASALFEPLGEEPANGQAAQVSIPGQTDGSKSSLLVDWAEFDKGTEDLAFLVKGVLPRVGIAQIYGDPGCGKTPVALSLAVHIAAGRETWFGHSIKRTSGRVVYMVGEGRSGLARRARAEALQLDLDIGACKDRLLWSTRPGRLTDAEDVALWDREIRALAGNDVALIVVDTQARNFGDGNENDSQDMSRFVNHLAALAERLGCLVKVVHHTGHTDKDRGRGSSVLFGALDACFQVERDGRTIWVTSTKAKDWEAPAPLEGHLVPVTLGHDEDGDPVTAVTLRDEPAGDVAVFEDLDAELGQDETRGRLFERIAELGGEPTTMRELLGPAQKSSASRLVDEFERRGFVKRSKHGRKVKLEFTQRGRTFWDSRGTAGTNCDDLFE